jgi:cysteine desulfurase
LLEGGSQEKSRRGGTENIVGIIGTGRAAEIASAEMENRLSHLNNLRKMLIFGLKAKIEDIIFNGHPEYALPNLVSVSIKFIEGESIVLMLDEEHIEISTKSACASGSLRASHVLVAIGRDYADAQGTVVLTFGRDTTEKEIGQFLEALTRAVRTLRSISPLYRKVDRSQ